MLKMKNREKKSRKKEIAINHRCQICGKQFRRKDSLKYHLDHHSREVINENYHCIGCNEKFKKENEKGKHELKCEKNESPSPLLCQFCDLSCDSPKKLRMHENKHRPIRKIKNLKNICVCIDCQKPFDSVSLLKVHMQSNHMSIVKPDGKYDSVIDPKNAVVIEIKQDDTSLDHSIEMETCLKESSSVSQIEFEETSLYDQMKKTILSGPFPEVSSKINQLQDKPFICWKCGSRYKYEKSKIKHELKYHSSSQRLPTKLNQNSSDGDTSRNIKSSQVSSEDGSSCSDVVTNNGGEESSADMTAVGVNEVHSENNNIIHSDIKKDASCPLSLVDVANRGLPEVRRDEEKQFGSRSHLIRQPIIKKKCIGCDSVFEGAKERDEHELKCSLNCFNKRFNCMFCDHPFRKPKALRKHENKHRPTRKTKKYKNRCVCIECNKTFDAIYSLRVHMKKLHQKCQITKFEKKPFACKICEARFKYENSKYKHEMRYHKDDLNQKIESNKGKNLSTNFNSVSDSDGSSIMCKIEKTDSEYADIDIKEEPVSNLFSEDCVEGIQENEVHNSILIKTETDTGMSLLQKNLSGDEMEIERGETAEVLISSHGIGGRKKKERKPCDRKTKKQKTGPYVCNNCEAKFNSPQGLWLHCYHQNMRTKRLSCIGCSRSFKSEKETEEHELRCNLNYNEYDFNCIFCDDPFGTPTLLRNHELQHKPLRRTKNYKCVCIRCKTPFESIHSLKEHIKDYHKANLVRMKNHEKKSDSISYVKKRSIMDEMMSCYVLLEDINEVRTEKGTIKPKSDRVKKKGTVNTCRVSTTAYRVTENDSDKSTRKIYADGLAARGDSLKIRYENDYNAEICDSSGNDKEPKMEDLKPKFLNVHETPAYLAETELTSQKNTKREIVSASFECGKCNAKFDSCEQLRHHSYSHRQRTKRQFCVGCGAGFEQSNDRDKHELDCKVNVSDRQLSCIFCELRFSTAQSLRNHENKHRPPKRYKRYKHMCLCAECDRAFDAIFTLKVHIRHMHSGSKEIKTIEERGEADVKFESDLTLEEYKCDGDLKVEK